MTRTQQCAVAAGLPQVKAAAITLRAVGLPREWQLRIDTLIAELDARAAHDEPALVLDALQRLQALSRELESQLLRKPARS